MLSRRVRRRTVVGLALINTMYGGSAIALPSSGEGFSIALQHETVSDSVGYSPNLQQGGFAAVEQKPRFQSTGFALSYTPDQLIRYRASLKQRHMHSLRDSFVINELSAGIKRRLHSKFSAPHTLDIGFETRFNYASEIYKNSYTSYADHLITEVRLKQPRDVRLSVRADLGVVLTDHLQLDVAFSGGLSQTRQEEVVGSAKLDNDCRYVFNASTTGGVVRQEERCGNLVSYEQRYPTSQALNNKLGFSVADDVTYWDYFFGPQLSLRWMRGGWSLGTGYELRQYIRPMLDDRILKAGGKPVSSSHSAFLKAGVNVFRHWNIAAQVQYQQAAFLDDIPFLYNALTYERYRNKSVLRYALSVSRYF